MENRIQVCVIGAGPSGIAAAKNAVRFGFDVVVDGLLQDASKIEQVARNLTDALVGGSIPEAICFNAA